MVRECFFQLTPQDSAGCSNHRLQSYFLHGSHCEYDNGYIVFDCEDGSTRKEVWRIASDFVADQVTTDARPDVPDDPQMAISADTANIYHHYAPRGQFRPGHC